MKLPLADSTTLSLAAAVTLPPEAIVTLPVAVRVAGPAATTPETERLPADVTVRLPPTFDAPNAVAWPLVRLALPLAPLVFSDTAPVSRLVEPSVIVAFEAEVVNDEVPPTVTAKSCVRLPALSVTVRLPPTVP